MHVLTEKRLHSHDVRPPVTEVDWQNEVSGYGYPGFEGDANDYFKVEIVKDYSRNGVSQRRLRYAYQEHGSDVVPLTPSFGWCICLLGACYSPTK
jgi:dolichyl-phosphate-mannose--protein O-mannosyl transferase